MYILTESNLSLHKITSVFQSAFIFMSFRIREFKICIFWQHLFIDTYLIEHNRHFLSTYFFVNPLELLYRSYNILRILVDKPSMIRYFPSTSCSTLRHHQGRMYYKSDVTFVCTLLLCKNKRL